MTDDRDPPADRKRRDELRDAFRELARERVAAKRKARRERRRRALVSSGLTALIALFLGGGIAVGIGAFTADDNNSLGGDLGAPGGVARQSPTDRLSSASSTADPGGGPPWGLSTYTSQRGQQCVIAARLVNGQLGLINAGKFTPLRKGVPGFCDRLSRNHLIFTVRAYSAGNGGRTLLYGQADREVQRLLLQTTSRGSRPVRLMSDGTFLVVVTSVNALRGSRLTAIVNGVQRTYRLA